jgi:hypothetical protein
MYKIYHKTYHKNNLYIKYEISLFIGSNMSINKRKALAVLDAADKMAAKSTIGMYSSKISCRAIDRVRTKIRGADPKAFKDYEQSEFATKLDEKFKDDSNTEKYIRKTQHFLRVASAASTVASIPAMALGPVGVVTSIASVGFAAGDASLTITNEVIDALKITKAFKETISDNIDGKKEVEIQSTKDVSTDKTNTSTNACSHFKQCLCDIKESANDKLDKDDDNVLVNRGPE